MATPDAPALRNVSDTALWVAVYRAQESERPDALFHDPYARRLAGERGARIAASATWMNQHAWSLVERTWLLDQIVMQEIAAGADMIINLAAGLDARPYRLDVPASLCWVEVDLPPLLAYKESILAAAVPRCRLQRERCDLADASARRRLFERLGAEARRALIVTEGLLIYLSAADAAALARDLSAPPSFQRWAFELAGPGLLRMMNGRSGSMGEEVARAGSPYRFAPAEGPAWFRPFGWQPLAIHSPLRSALRHHRLSWGMRLAALFSQSHPGHGRRPWSGICHMERMAIGDSIDGRGPLRA
ncbi:MAG: class I SAM-dependent methyltransferase [Terriglobales bacterium]